MAGRNALREHPLIDGRGPSPPISGSCSRPQKAGRRNHRKVSILIRYYYGKGLQKEGIKSLSMQSPLAKYYILNIRYIFLLPWMRFQEIITKIKVVEYARFICCHLLQVLDADQSHLEPGNEDAGHDSIATPSPLSQLIPTLQPGRRFSAGSVWWAVGAVIGFRSGRVRTAHRADPV